MYNLLLFFLYKKLDIELKMNIISERIKLFDGVVLYFFIIYRFFLFLVVLF